MNIVYLSPHFPPNYYLFCVNLRKVGGDVLGIGDIPYQQLRAELKWAFKDYCYVENMEDYQQLLRACGYFTYRHGKLNWIDSLNEHWLEAESKVRCDFNIPGMDIDNTRRFRNKSTMREIFTKLGILVAQGKKISDFKQAEKFVEQAGYPLVLKPDSGVGAANTYRLNNREDLERFWAIKPPDDYIMEKFIDGNICSFDGLTDKDGKIVFYTAHQYCDGVMEIVNEDRHTAYYSLREIPQEMIEAGCKIVKGFGLTRRFFHLEFFRTDNGLIPLEINLRPPGGYTTDMFNYACDIDIYRQWANIVVGNRFNENYTRKYHCIFISRKRSKSYAHSHQQILQRYASWLVFDAEMPAVFSQAMGNYCYIARSESLEKIFEIKKFVHKLSENSYD